MKHFLYLLAALLIFNACSSDKDVKVKDLVPVPSLGEEALVYKAMNTYDRGLYSLSKDTWTELRDGYPASFYVPLAEIKIADCFYYTGDYTAAQLAYEEFVQLHTGHEAVAYARFQIANCNKARYKGPLYDQVPLHTAMVQFRELIKDYPDGEYSLLARRAINECRELLAIHEAYVAEFYRKQGKLRASAMRFQSLTNEFADSDAAKNAQVSLVTTIQTEQDEQIIAIMRNKELVSNEVGIPAQAKTPPSTPRVLEQDFSEMTSQMIEYSLLKEVVAEAPLPQPSARIIDQNLITELNHAEETTQIQFVELVSCELLDQTILLSTQFNRPYIISHTDTEETNKVRLSISTVATGKKLEQNSIQSQQLTCEKSGASLVVEVKNVKLAEAAPDSESEQLNPIVELKFTIPEGYRYTVLPLDRPERIIIVAENQ